MGRWTRGYRPRARANRAFLAGHALSGHQGIRQFLDIGSGIPTARQCARGLRTGQRGLPGGLRRPRSGRVAEGRNCWPAMTTPSSSRLTSVSRTRSCPIRNGQADRLRRAGRADDGGDLAFREDADDPERIVARFRTAIAPGSYIAVSHVTSEANPGWPQRLKRSTTTAQRTGRPVPGSRSAFFGAGR